MGAGKIVKLTWSDGPEQTTETVTGFSEVGETNWSEYTPSISGFGTVTRAKAYWRKSGPEILIRGQFRTGTPEASSARISLPNLLISTEPCGQPGLDGYPYDVAGRGITSRTNTKLCLVHLQFQKFLSIGNASGSGLFSPTDGNLIAAASGETFLFDARVRIRGYEF
jgi:hypothetical protein